MSSVSYFFTSILLSLLINSIAESRPVKGKLQIHPWFAANCIALSDNCSYFFSNYSGSVCLEKTSWNEQPVKCIEYACNWCQEWTERSMRNPCGSDNVKNACKMLLSDSNDRSTPKSPPMTPDAMPEPEQGPEPKREEETEDPRNGQCTWTGQNDKIVIDLGKVPLGTGWDRVMREGYTGIIFNRSPHEIISPKGKYGEMCFKVKAPMSGKYYLTAISYAPHNTEHNDVWVKTSKGLELWQNGDMEKYVGPREWLKAYQNNGKKGMSEHFKTIDFDGHRFLVPNVEAGEEFQVCLSGRSKKYEMYRLILYKCEGMYCTGGIMSGEMLFNLKPSQCINY